MCAAARAIGPGTNAAAGAAPSENRGAGVGCVTPSTLAYVPRAARCGWDGASVIESTGATHASLPSNTFDHSVIVRSAKRAANACRIRGHRAWSRESGRSAGTPSGAKSSVMNRA